MNYNELRDFAHHAQAMISSGAVEDRLRHYLSSKLPSIFPGSPWWIQAHMEGTEAHVRFSVGHRNREGFVDAVVGKTAIGLKSGSAMGLESDLMIYEDEIGIDSKGTGKQIFIKTDFALERSGENVDVILVEEPENHLSPVNLRKLIQRVSDTQSGQLFITTHNSLISTRLELKNLLIMHINGTDKPIMLKDLCDETAKYFMKAPPASIIEFALAKKAILVEGPSEYMLMEKFYKTCAGCSPESDGVHIIDVRGLSFKRYLDIAKLTGCKVAIITDNDTDYRKHCVDKYSDYASSPNIKIFYEVDDAKRTFEIILYGDNPALCDTLFDSPALDYMLNNKTEAAYALLSQDDQIVVPDYIKRGIKWIKE